MTPITCHVAIPEYNALVWTIVTAANVNNDATFAVDVVVLAVPAVDDVGSTGGAAITAAVLAVVVAVFAAAAATGAAADDNVADVVDIVLPL